MKAKSSTTLAAVVLKEELIKYTSESIDVYACLMDICRVFERVNNDLVIRKLAELKMSPLIVRAIELYSIIAQLAQSSNFHFRSTGVIRVALGRLV